MLIKKTEEPERNASGTTNFRIVYRKRGIRLILDLFKGFAGTSNLKKEFTVNEEIAALGVGSLPTACI